MPLQFVAFPPVCEVNIKGAKRRREKRDEEEKEKAA
jgi:hypothetical protein